MLKDQSMQVLDHWNSKKCFTSHKDPSKKNYNMALWCVKCLLSGTFGEKCELDEDFTGDNGITQAELEYKFTVEEICEVIDRYEFMMTSEQYADKSKFSRSLDYFIYNPTTKRSFFLGISGSRIPKGMPEPSLDIDILKLYRRRLDLYRYDEQDIITGTNPIIKQWHHFYDTIGRHYHAWEWHKSNFFELHIRYIWEKWRDRENFNVRLIGNTVPDWKDWMQKEEKGSYRFYFEVSNQRIDEAMAKYKVEEEDMKKLAEEIAKQEKEREDWKKMRESMGKRDSLQNRAIEAV